MVVATAVIITNGELYTWAQIANAMSGTNGGRGSGIGGSSGSGTGFGIGGSTTFGPKPIRMSMYRTGMITRCCKCFAPPFDLFRNRSAIDTAYYRYIRASVDFPTP